MKKSFPSQEEAFDKAKQMGLTPEQAARQITTTQRVSFLSMMRSKGRL